MAHDALQNAITKAANEKRQEQLKRQDRGQLVRATARGRRAI